MYNMYHPGGFGNSKSNNAFPEKEDPPLLVPLAVFVIFLILWVICFFVGLEFGMGWYAWPLGTLCLFIIFLTYNLFKHHKST
jgi:hypothetical protein